MHGFDRIKHNRINQLWQGNFANDTMIILSVCLIHCLSTRWAHFTEHSVDKTFQLWIQITIPVNQLVVGNMVVIYLTYSREVGVKIRKDKAVPYIKPHSCKCREMIFSFDFWHQGNIVFSATSRRCCVWHFGVSTCTYVLLQASSFISTFNQLFYLLV